ncbi:MAG: SUMF1/EgtB/PvdO family nonheme iron enzyme [Phycisphaerales bacterium]
MHRVILSLAVGSCAVAANAKPAPPDYGFDFVTIGDPGNDPWMGTDVSGRITNPGSIDYEYRIARFETRTSQFIEFMNTLGQLSPQTAIFQEPGSWGGVGFVEPDGSVRFELANSPTAADQPVIGISWRLSAIYCNWLHNDKGQTLDDLNFGAYDTSTFMTDPDNPPNLLDQASRNPGARYWIPSLDEWLKAAHYDPDKNGPGDGGWWQYPNGSDQPLTPGLPGEPGAQTSYQLDVAQFDERTIPVGAYPDVQSPYGLLDVSGSAAEWTETYLPDIFQTSRIFGGSSAGPNPFADLGVNLDAIAYLGSESLVGSPGGPQGIRIASAVPSPTSSSLVGITLIAGGARRRRRSAVLALAAAALALPAAAQQPPPDYGFDFITISDMGNDAYSGVDPNQRITGRGSVGYAYRIARFETRTSQFMEFMNTLGQLSPQTAIFQEPGSWGGVGFVNGDGTVRFELANSPNAADQPVIGISWRLSAVYCNWLHNDKGQTLDDLNFGAYDTSTFGTDPDNPPNLTDQAMRSPDARYWIPSLDEWLKAAHYDPNKNGPGDGGWWQYPNGTDQPLTPGLPGEPGAQTSYGLDVPGFIEETIPVGAYPDVESPYGLLDVSGGAAEWTESYTPDIFQTKRDWGGSAAGMPATNDQDRVYRIGSDTVGLPGGPQGIRIASAVPSPASASLVGITLIAGGARRRRSVVLAATACAAPLAAQQPPPD